MTRIIVRHNSPGQLKNYHSTICNPVADDASCSDPGGPDLSLVEWLTGYASAYQKIIAASKSNWREVTCLGGAWSFSRLIGTTGCSLKMVGHPKLYQLSQTDLTTGAGCPSSPIVMVGGGAGIGEVNSWLEANYLSLKTSGSHDGQSFVGAVATGTHGSALNFGGMQNHVVGMHVITGENSSVWLESCARPVLSESTSTQIATRVIRDKRLFNGALVHLGGMGIVNAVAIEPAAYFELELVNQIRGIDGAWIKNLSVGGYRKAAEAFDYDLDPYFYELTVDPFSPFEIPAIHRLLFKSDQPKALNVSEKAAPQILDLIRPPSKAGAAPLAEQQDEVNVMQWLLAQTQIFPDASGDRKYGSWGALHGKHEPVAPLFSAAFAIHRSDLLRALQTMSQAITALPPHFVFTVRFVKNAAGAMAFTRFDESAIINIDGLGEPKSSFGPDAADHAAAALGVAGVDFSLHWGKLGPLSPHKVHRDFGPPSSRAADWTAARKALLATASERQIFGNDALRSWRLI